MNTFLIYQEIGAVGVTSSDVVDFLSANKKKDVQIRINSVGGSVTEGIAIYNLLKSHSGKVFVSIDSICASIATIIALGGDFRTMNLGSTFMIHNPYTFTQGEASDLRKTADELDQVQSQLVSIYKKFCKKSESEIIEMMNQTTWLSDIEALDLGFVDSIENEVKAVAQVQNWELEKYFNILPKNEEKMKEKTEKVSSEVDEVEVEKNAEETADLEAPATETEEAPEEAPEEEVKSEELPEEEEEIQAPEAPEEVEETPEEAEEEVEEEIKAKISKEVLNSADVKNIIENKVQAGIKAEMKRREEIHSLSFAGQEELVLNLIEENSSLQESAMRIIENKKELDLKSGEVKNSAPAELSPAQKLLKKMANSAPAPLNEGSGEEIESLDQMKASYQKLKDPKEKTLLVQKMAKLKKEIASSNNKR